MKEDLLKRSNGDFAIGEDTFRKKLAADEMITLPLDELLAIAEKDLRKNQAAFADTARLIDPKATPMQVLAKVQENFPPAAKLLSTTQAELDALGRFMTDHHLVTIPKAPPATVQETPPFLRATTSASMEIPGPFETVATEAYYNMTLPDPKLSAKDTREFMKQWYYAAISNVSVHEVWPGHYLQFLYGKTFPSDIRKVLGANSNSEGWAHYCEQMVIDEGFHADDPRYRLAQIQDALLRDARFIVGIRMHTKGMTVAAGGRLLREGGLSAAPGRPLREQARHVGSDLRLLHDGQADDSEAARRLQGEDGRRVFAAEVPRHVHRPRAAAAAAHPPGDARRERAALLSHGQHGQATDNTDNTEHRQHGLLS